MKRAEWFVLLPYPGFEALLPQSDVGEALGRRAGDAPPVDFDALLLGAAAGENRRQPKKTVFALRNGGAIETASVPQLVAVELSEFSVFGGELGAALLQTGIVAARFCRGKMQYVFDAQKMLEKSAQGKRAGE